MGSKWWKAVERGVIKRGRRGGMPEEEGSNRVTWKINLEEKEGQDAPVGREEGSDRRPSSVALGQESKCLPFSAELKDKLIKQVLNF